MDDVGKVVAGLRAAVADLPAAELRRARECAEEGAAAVHRVTPNSGSDEPGRMVAAIGQACEAVDHALREFDGAARDLHAYIVQVGGDGAAPVQPGWTGGVLPGQAVAPALRPGASTERAAPAEWTGRLQEWTFRRGTRMRTRGVRIVDGFAVSDLCSGGDVYAAKVDDHWKSVRRPGESETLTVSRHAELKFAAYMRDHELRDETIVINKPAGPCAGDYGCEELLARFLPPGSTLTVCWPGGNSRTYKSSETA